jgi:hypothetical protein
MFPFLSDLYKPELYLAVKKPRLHEIVTNGEQNTKPAQ